MKKTKLCAMTLALAMLTTTVLAACGANKVELTDKPLAGETLVDFANGADSSVLFESDGWTNGDVFNVVWTKGNVKYEGGLLKLGITEEKKNAWLNDEEVTFDYTAGEARTQNYYGYGDYEVKMKPSANPGTASTFFICTGNYDEKYVLDAEGNVVYNDDGSVKTEKNPHDEIDIEFLGKDTTHVQFNFFVDGKGGNEYMYDLGFDASKEFHEYGFRWEKDSITWFVDNVPVYKVTTDKNVKTGDNVRYVEKLPSTPGRMLANYWCGNTKAEGWMGKYKGNTVDNGCEYQWMQTSAEGKPLNPSLAPEQGTETPDVEWNPNNAIDLTFGSTDKYTVTNNGTASNVTYTEIGGSTYLNVEMDITAAAAGKNVLHLTLKNNGTADSQIRVNVIDDALLSSGAQNASTNKSATMDGAEVFTDLSWGGSFFLVPAGAEAEAVVYFDGTVEKLQLMIDSSRNDASTYAGDVTISNVIFAGENGEDTPDTPDTPDVPSGNATDLTFFVEADKGYTVDPLGTAAGSVHVLYTGKGNSYLPMVAEVAELAAGNNTFSIKVKNNGAEAIRVRVDVQGTTWVATGENGQGTDCCNVSCVGGSSWTDTNWGGSHLDLAAGEEATLVITYNGAGAQGAVKNVLIFAGSSIGQDVDCNTDITISEFCFSSAS